MIMFVCLGLYRKYPFWANLEQKIRITCLRWNLVPRLNQLYRNRWRCSFVLLWTENTFLEKIGLKNQNYLFKTKLGSLANSVMPKSMVMFICLFLNRKSPLWKNLVKRWKSVWLIWNVMPIIFQIYWIRW